jgi:hypothetical protein
MRIDILKLEKLKKNSEKYNLNVKVINSKDIENEIFYSDVQIDRFMRSKKEVIVTYKIFEKKVVEETLDNGNTRIVESHTIKRLHVLVVIREQSLEELLEDLKSLQRHSKEERISKKLYKENKKIESSISEATLLKMIHEEIEAAL